MANRGVLPKFRPAPLGGSSRPVTRPLIRPVRPMAPPPPPSPPRRMSSDVRGARTYGPAIEPSDPGPATAPFADPPTVTASRDRLDAPAAELSSGYDPLPCFDDETQARAVGDVMLLASRYQVGESDASLDVAYESLPSLAIERPMDDYEADFVEHDPATQLRAARHESMRVRHRSESPRYPSVEESGSHERPRAELSPAPRDDVDGYGADYPSAVEDGDPPTRREESYPRARREESQRPGSDRPVYSSASGSAPPVAPGISIPSEAVPAGFVMGVQPLRMTGSLPGFASAEAPSLRVHGTVDGSIMGLSHVPTGGTLAASPHALHGASYPARPIGHQLELADTAPPSRSKANRFAWFVFGSTFGILFMFFATGFGAQLGAKDEVTFPPPAPVPAPPVAAAAAPQPIAVPAATAPAAPPAATATQPAVTQPAAIAEAAPAAAAPAPPPRAAAPARGHRAVAVARRTAPVSAAPRPLPNSGSVDADDVPSSSSPSRSSASAPAPRGEKIADISGVGDLLSAGLAP